MQISRTDPFITFTALGIKLASVSGLLTGLLVICLRVERLQADPALAPTPDQVVSAVPLLPQQPVFQSMTAVLKTTNGSGSGTVSNAANQDSYEAWLLQTIEDQKRTLQNTNLNEGIRKNAEWMLMEQQASLANHEASVKQRLEFTKSVQADPKTAWTNILDPPTAALASDVARCQGHLADPALAANERAMYQFELKDYQQKLSDHITNAQLWANVHLAHEHQSPEQIAQAEKQLANYLAVKLGQLQGKTYPQGMSLDAVMEQYRRQFGDYETSRRKIMLGVLILTLLAPLAVISWLLLKRRLKRFWFIGW